MLWNLVKSLRPWAIVVAVVVWNVVGLMGIWLNGGTGRIRTMSSGFALVLDCGLLAACAMAVAISPTWQRFALRPGVDPSEPRSGLVFIALLASGLAVAALADTFHSTHT